MKALRYYWLVLACVLLVPAGARPNHPIGPVDSPRPVGIAAHVEKVQCTDCHRNHDSGPDLLAPGATRGACLDCHSAVSRRIRSDPHLGGLRVTDKTMRVALARSDRDLAGDGSVLCTTCHEVHGGRATERTCTTCHPDVRGEAAHDSGHGDLNCKSCHDPHPGAAAKIWRSRTERDPNGCLGCHGEGAEHEPIDARPGSLGHSLQDHADVLPDQTDPPLEGCVSCHDAHAPTRPDSTSCLDCHVERRGDADLGGHGRNVTCLDCHPAHQAKPRSEMAFNPVTQRCLGCHAEGAEGSSYARTPRVEAFEHPAAVFEPGDERWKALSAIPLFGPTGVKLPPEQNGDLTCSSCHLTHAPEEGREWAKRRLAGIVEACAQCHAEDAHGLYLYFHQADRRKNLRTEPTRRP